jgi:hypothetical protein
MKKSSSTIIIVLLAVIIGILLYNNYSRKHVIQPGPSNNVTTDKHEENKSVSIDELTKESVVVPFVKQNGRLPDCYITKKEAREHGWDAAKGNLCDVLPGKAIGGDIFTNRERTLPVKNGRTWYEADLNYNCEHRNSHRLLFSNDGLVFVTHDHYKTFEEQ